MVKKVNRKTRKQRGGAVTDADTLRIKGSMKRIQNVQGQLRHTISQLKRFNKCFKDGDMRREKQFAYNLGRLQELCFETTHPEIWWKPFEKFFETSDWDGMGEYIDELKNTLGVEYEEDTIAKGCD